MEIDSMKTIVEELTKDSPAYRLPRTEGHEKAKIYLIQKLSELGLVPGNKRSWLQPIRDINRKIVGENIIGVLPGRSDKYLLIITHYDTIPGISGANDNAAAIAIVLETLKNLTPWQGESNIMVLISDLEETPYFYSDIMGSTYFYNNCPIDNVKISCAIVLDLVGHDVPCSKLSNVLFVMGSEKSDTLFKLVYSSHVNKEGINIIPIENAALGIDYSDHHVFAVNNRPFLFLSCGIAAHYHNAADTIGILNFKKMSFISQYLGNLINEFDNNVITNRESNALEKVVNAERDLCLLLDEPTGVTLKSLHAAIQTLMWKISKGDLK